MSDICIGALIGIVISAIFHAIGNTVDRFGLVETNIENGQTLFRFTFERDPKSMIFHKRAVFKVTTNKELHSLKDIGDTDSQK